MDLGFPEILIILVIVLVLFGGAKLPQLGASLGKGIRGFKDAMSGKDEETPKAPPSQQASQGEQAPQAQQPAAPVATQEGPPSSRPGSNGV